MCVLTCECYVVLYHLPLCAKHLYPLLISSCYAILMEYFTMLCSSFAVLLHHALQWLNSSLIVSSYLWMLCGTESSTSVSKTFIPSSNFTMLSNFAGIFHHACNIAKHGEIGLGLHSMVKLNVKQEKTRINRNKQELTGINRN